MRRAAGGDRNRHSDTELFHRHPLISGAETNARVLAPSQAGRFASIAVRLPERAASKLNLKTAKLNLKTAAPGPNAFLTRRHSSPHLESNCPR